MRFSVVVNRWANFYFFVQNLSEWHFSYRRAYNDLWRKELGGFSPEEEKALQEFKTIHKKYPFGNLNLGRQFFRERDPWRVLEKKVSSEELVSLKEIFLLFGGKFVKLYEKEFPLLEQWQALLQKELGNETISAMLNTLLSKLFKAPPFRETAIVYLLLSSEDYTGGSAGIDDKSISIEISRYPLGKSNHALGILWHELVHLHFEKHSFLRLIAKKFPNDSNAIKLIKEAAASSLFPNGVLGTKFFGEKDKQLNTKIPEDLTKNLLALTGEYVEKNISFDEDYISKLYSFVAPLKGILK